MASTQTGELLNRVIPALVRVARGPGALLLATATSAVAMFAVLGLLLGRAGHGWSAWVPFSLALLLALPVLTLAVRRARLQRRTRDLDLDSAVVGGTEVVVLAPGHPRGPRGAEPSDREQEILDEARAEAAARRARFMPGLEAAQRAARVAAGGTVHAPYLADDLRVTLVALIGTLAAIPLGLAGAFVTALLLAAAAA